MACNLVSRYSIALNLAYNKNKHYKTLDYWSRDMLNFNLLEKSSRLVSLSHFEYDFSRKMFLMLHFSNWPNFIARLPLLLEILGNMCITIVNPCCDVIKFEIIPFHLFYQAVATWPKSQEKNFNILRTKRAFDVK